MSSAQLTVLLQPRARHNELVNEREGTLRARVTAAPVDGKANAALCRLIAKRAGIAASSVTILHGHRSRMKVLRVDGLTDEELRLALGLEQTDKRPSDIEP